MHFLSPIRTRRDNFMIQYISLLVVIVILLIWVWMMVDCITNKRLNGIEKILWLLVILFAQPIGAFLYLFVGRLLISNLRRKKERQTSPVYPSYQQGYQPLQQPMHNHQEYEQYQHSSQPQYEQPEVTYPADV